MGQVVEQGLGHACRAQGIDLEAAQPLVIADRTGRGQCVAVFRIDAVVVVEDAEGRFRHLPLDRAYIVSQGDVESMDRNPAVGRGQFAQRIGLGRPSAGGKYPPPVLGKLAHEFDAKAAVASGDEDVGHGFASGVRAFERRNHATRA